MLGRAFLSACEARGAQDFLVDSNMRLSGLAAAEQSTRLATALLVAGLAARRHVAFLARPSAQHAVTWFAAIRLGALVTNLHLLDTPPRLADTIEWLESALLVYDDEFAALAGTIANAVPGLRTAALTDLWATIPAVSATLDLDNGQPDDPIAIVLSSGSTGRPKGVVHTHASMQASIAAGVDIYRGIDATSSALVCIGTSFGGWCNTVIPFACLSTKIVFQRRFDPDTFLQGLADERITVAPLVPTMWRLVLAAQPDRYDLSSVKLAFMSGEMPSRADVEAIHAKITPCVRSAYLSTEGACGCGFVMDEDVLLAELEPAARPTPGVEVRIDAIGDVNEPGEIVLRGPSLAVGYWKDERRTNERFQNGWWRTGDTGVLTDDGRLRVVGRTDHVINSGGIKVQAEEIEAGLMRHPHVRQAAVVGKPDPLWGQRAEAYVVLSNELTSASALLDWCKQREELALSKLLKQIHIVGQLPTGPTGKLFRPALLEIKD